MFVADIFAVLNLLQTYVCNEGYKVFKDEFRLMYFGAWEYALGSENNRIQRR